MRAALILFAACWTNKPPPAPPVPTEAVARTCNDAAMGIERATRNLRAPDTDVLGPIRTACTNDTWSAAAIDCFATMKDDELGKCVGKLLDANRDKLFTALGGDYDDRAAIAVASARLGSIKVGIAECDQFVTTVATVLACEAMPLTQRVQLGNETADFWSLPAKLPANAVQRMQVACNQSLVALQQQAAAAGCKP